MALVVKFANLTFDSMVKPRTRLSYDEYQCRKKKDDFKKLTGGMVFVHLQ